MDFRLQLQAKFEGYLIVLPIPLPHGFWRLKLTLEFKIDIRLFLARGIMQLSPPRTRLAVMGLGRQSLNPFLVPEELLIQGPLRDG